MLPIDCWSLHDLRQDLEGQVADSTTLASSLSRVRFKCIDDSTGPTNAMDSWALSLRLNSPLDATVPWNGTDDVDWNTSEQNASNDTDGENLSSGDESEAAT